MLRSRTRWPLAGLAAAFRSLHDRMDSCILWSTFRPPVRTWRADRWHVRPPTIPDAADVVTRDDLRETTCLDVTNFNEPAVEQQDVGGMPCNPFSSSFPFNRSGLPAGVTMSINI